MNHSLNIDVVGLENRDMDGLMDGWKDGWTDGWMDEWMDGRMYRQ